MRVDPLPTIVLSDRQRDALLAAALVHPMDMHKRPLLSMIGPRMRAYSGLPGDGWSKLMTVLLEPGMSIPSHRHRRHTVLFYPAGLSENPVIGLPDGPYWPQPGEVLYLPPDTLHDVPPHAARRLTVAMLIDTALPTKKAA